MTAPDVRSAAGFGSIGRINPLSAQRIVHCTPVLDVLRGIVAVTMPRGTERSQRYCRASLISRP